MITRYAWVAWALVAVFVVYHAYEYAMSLKRAADVEVLH
jgi:hypothetical protein